MSYSATGTGIKSFLTIHNGEIVLASKINRNQKEQISIVDCSPHYDAILKEVIVSSECSLFGTDFHLSLYGENSSDQHFDNTRADVLPSHRQGRILGPLLGFFLASLFPSLAIARLQHGSIKFQYDPAPLVHPNLPPLINLFQTSVPTQAPISKQPEKLYLESTASPEYYGDGPDHFPETVSTNLESTDYLIPASSNNQKVAVKRAVSSRYLPAYSRNRYNTRRRIPAYLDYENYDYFTNLRLRNRRRNQGRRPAGLDYDDDYDYDFPGRGKKKKQQRKRNKNNRNYPDYYSDEDLDNDVESVTVRLRPRQQQTTTTESTDMATTVITNGTTPATTHNTTSTGYGYGSSNGNENISITYGPPSAIKPVYGVPGVAYGTPLNEWSPSYTYESASSYPSHHQGSYYSPASYHYPSSYGALSSSYTPQGASYSPNVSYGLPTSPGETQSKHYPGTSYGIPSTSYGVPSHTYSAPGHSSPGQSPGSPSGRASSYQSYQLPFSSWYGRSTSHSDIVRRAQDIIKYN